MTTTPINAELLRALINAELLRALQDSQRVIQGLIGQEAPDKAWFAVEAANQAAINGAASVISQQTPAEGNASSIGYTVICDTTNNPEPIGEVVGAFHSYIGKEPTIKWAWKPQSGSLPCPIPVGSKLYLHPKPSEPAVDAAAEAHYLWDDAVSCDFEGFKAKIINLVERSKAPVSISAEKRGLIAAEIQARNRHTGITTVRYYVDAICDRLER